MRTTIDLPDALFRAAKSKAAKEGTSLKKFIAHAIQAAVENRPAPKKYRATFPIIPKSKLPYFPSLTNTEIDQLLNEEDLDRPQ